MIVRYRLYRLCDPREQVMFLSDPGPRTGTISAVQLSSATFATQKVCKLLLQIARLLSKVKVSKLFAQLFAPIKSVHEESCEKSLQTFTFFATFCSHKKRCYARFFVIRIAFILLYAIILFLYAFFVVRIALILLYAFHLFCCCTHCIYF